MCEARTSVITFIAANVGLILAVIALASTNWVMGNTTNSTEVINTTCSKGLWDSSCGMPDAIFKNETKEEMFYFTLTQYFYGFSAGNCLVGVLIMYFMLLVQKCADSRCCFGLVTFVLLFATLEGVVAITLLGTSYIRENTFPIDYYNLFLGWSYWVAVASVGNFFVAALTSAFSICSKREHLQRQYQRL